jgi:hypothetical protein
MDSLDNSGNRKVHMLTKPSIMRGNRLILKVMALYVEIPLQYSLWNRAALASAEEPVPCRRMCEAIVCPPEHSLRLRIDGFGQPEMKFIFAPLSSSVFLGIIEEPCCEMDKATSCR